jgi:hypothetical protein
MLESMSKIKMVSTIIGDNSHNEQIESFDLGDDLAEMIEHIYHLKEKYS